MATKCEVCKSSPDHVTTCLVCDTDICQKCKKCKDSDDDGKEVNSGRCADCEYVETCADFESRCCGCNQYLCGDCVRYCDNCELETCQLCSFETFSEKLLCAECRASM